MAIPVAQFGADAIQAPGGTPEPPPNRRRGNGPVEACVYFIYAAEYDRVKIGVAVDPRGRLSEIQTANFTPLALVRALPSKDAYALEAELHEKYARYHVQGEWFSGEAMREALAAVDLRTCLRCYTDKPLKAFEGAQAICRACENPLPKVKVNRTLPAYPRPEPTPVAPTPVAPTPEPEPPFTGYGCSECGQVFQSLTLFDQHRGIRPVGKSVGKKSCQD